MSVVNRNCSIFLTALSLFIVGCKNRTATENNPTSGSPKKVGGVFEKVPVEKSNLFFENNLKENLSTLENLFNYDYFYNGAGVGIIDYDNDGLQDIFFCGNQVENKLYKNLGNLTFEDVSLTSGINKNKVWSNGISIVDINNDGWMDIYISQGGPNPRSKRKNLLFVNQQDGTFKEMAEEVGLADMGISTQSAFFDYDNDGDLDCFVMNENEYYGLDPIALAQLVKKNGETKYFNSSHFYQNDNGKFIDVTEQVGILRPIFGLGLTIADINQDNLLDIYVASDYYIPDALFINNGDGTFSDRIKDYTQQISYYGMGMDIADIDNDNLQDIFVLDMAANDHVRSKTLMASMNTKRFDYLVNKADYHYQYMYNSLQLNQGNNHFSNISQLAGLANTDWSWSVLMADYDLDGDKDIYVTNGYRRYALDNDLQQKVYQAKVKYKGNIPLDVKKMLYESMPSEKLPNILFENEGNLTFTEVANKWGLGDYSFSNGAAMADLDNDGDLDMVVNNMDENAFLYQNTSVENKTGNYLKVFPKGNLSESYPTISVYYNGRQQMIESRSVRGYRSSHENIALFGLADTQKMDSVTIKWPSGKTEVKKNVDANQELVFNEKNAGIGPTYQKNEPEALFQEILGKRLGLDHRNVENPYDDFEKEILLPYKQSNQGPFIAQGDVDNDGLEDILIGGPTGQAAVLYLQTKKGTFQSKKNIAFENDRQYEDMQSVFFDLDNDGDLDLYTVSGGNEFLEFSSLYSDRVYINDGKGGFQRTNAKALQEAPKSGKSVAVIDYDSDGFKDILVGNRIIPQNYPRYAASTLLRNNQGVLEDVTDQVIPDLKNFGMINDVLITDFDTDGLDDIITVGEWTNIGFFKNMGGQFKMVSDLGFSNENGWWFSINETDVNNDGLKDYLVGNVGLNIKFKANKKKPFKIFANDFDDNGTPDIVLSKKYNGEFVPVRGRECSSQQMPFIKDKFKTYNEFANAKLIDIYGEKLDAAYETEMTQFNSTLLVNKGNGKFEQHTLPIEAQFFPIMNAAFLDMDNDGFEDCILAGNLYETEVETPRLDAISGLVLMNNKKNGYTPLPFPVTGLYLKGNIKDIGLMKLKDNTMLLLATLNNDAIKSYKIQNQKK